MKKAILLGTLLTAGCIFGEEVQTAVYHPSDGVAMVQVARRRVYRQRRRVVVHRRSGRKSAAIVAGSAAGGAAIGALAGGGKGAAIGALVGGGSGFVYDRATHKKVVTQ